MTKKLLNMANILNLEQSLERLQSISKDMISYLDFMILNFFMKKIKKKRAFRSKHPKQRPDYSKDWLKMAKMTKKYLTLESGPVFKKIKIIFVMPFLKNIQYLFFY